MEIITNKSEIINAFRKYRKNIEAKSEKYLAVTIGWPSGSETGTLLFLQNYSTWANIPTRPTKNTLSTIYGTGAVSKKGMNHITVAITFSTTGNFSPQGNILKDNGKYYIGHTGSVNVGYGNKHHLKSSTFNKQTYKTDTDRERELYCIAEIIDKDGNTSEQSISKICKYVKEIAALKNETKVTLESSEHINISGDEEGGQMHSDGWVYKRSPKLVKARKRHDQYQCQICGFKHKNRIVHVHHIKPISKSKEAKITNIDELVTLCPNCHGLAHYVMLDGETNWNAIKKQVIEINVKLS